MKITNIVLKRTENDKIISESHRGTRYYGFNFMLLNNDLCVQNTRCSNLYDQERLKGLLEPVSYTHLLLQVSVTSNVSNDTNRRVHKEVIQNNNLSLIHI